MAKKKKTLDRSDFISITALVMSMIAVFVSIYEAGILKEQQLIMLSQEKTAVWPYLDGNLSYTYSDKIYIRYNLENKGIGPARIRSMKMSLNQQEITEYVMLLDSLVAYFPEQADLGVSYMPTEMGILSPEEEITVLNIECNRFPGDIETVRNMQFSFEVCYCSVYDDCWRIDGGGGIPEPGCE